MKYDLEALIEELAVAERSGVFAKTPQPVAASKVRAGQSSFFLVSPRWAIAAALLMAAGVWTFMFRSNLSDVRERARMANAARSMDLQMALASCSGGPGGTLSVACERVDFDRDGDVDLLDIGTFQRDLAAVSQ